MCGIPTADVWLLREFQVRSRENLIEGIVLLRFSCGGQSVQMPLEVNERRKNPVRAAKYRNGIRKRLILELQKVRQLFLIEFPDPGFYVFGKHEFDKLFLFLVQSIIDAHLGFLNPCCTRSRF